MLSRTACGPCVRASRFHVSMAWGPTARVNSGRMIASPPDTAASMVSRPGVYQGMTPPDAKCASGSFRLFNPMAEAMPFHTFWMPFV